MLSSLSGLVGLGPGRVCEPFCVPMLLSVYAGLSNDDASMCSGLGSVMGCWESPRFPFVMIPGHEIFRVGWYDYW